MKDFNVTDQQLINLIEGKCSTDESRKIKDAIEMSKELKDQFNELLFIHNSMNTHSIVKAPNNFLDHVMANLTNKKINIIGMYDSINKLGLKLLISGITLLAITLLYVSRDAIVIDLNSLILNSTIVDKSYVSNPTNLINDKFIVNGLLFVGTVVSLVIFDKVILKPWFTKRRSLQQ